MKIRRKFLQENNKIKELRRMKFEEFGNKVKEVRIATKPQDLAESNIYFVLMSITIKELSRKLSNLQENSLRTQSKIQRSNNGSNKIW